MDMVPVSSSQIAAVGYDPETMVAEVQFSNGSVYRYEGVPLGVTDEIIKSESPGRQFSASLKFGYTYSRIS
jgi:KTSC domain